MKNAEIVLQNINTLFDDETKKELKSSIEDFSNLTSSLSETSDEISKLIADNSENLTNSLSDFRSASNNIKSITDSLNSDDIKSITINLNSLVNNLNSITTSLKNSEGTAGKLINDKSIYDNLEKVKKIHGYETKVRVHELSFLTYSTYSVLFFENEDFKTRLETRNDNYRTTRGVRHFDRDFDVNNVTFTVFYRKLTYNDVKIQINKYYQIYNF